MQKQTSLISTASSNADVLRWQHRLRVVIATAVVGGAFALDSAGVHRSHVGVLALALGAYAAVCGGVIVMAQRARAQSRVINALSAVSVLSDLGFLFAFTAATSSPTYYGRTLVVAFLIVHLAETYFGRRLALLTVFGALAGYLTLVALAPPGALDWGESLWTVTVFVASAGVVLAQFGTVHRRLLNIVALFERAEEGDFAKSYDVAADRYPDVVTRVGRAYNRVRVHLASMVLSDPLTGCLNRRGFDQSLAREVARSARSGSDLALLALDIDHFKAINDTYGHLAGDAVLREFGALLVQTARAGDMVARTGGEEFSILLPDTTADGSELFAQRLCDAVRAQVFHVNGKPITVTISIGVTATGSAGVGDPGANMKERADQALYGAKRAGRDRVRRWSPELVMDGLAQPAAPSQRNADLLSQ